LHQYVLVTLSKARLVYLKLEAGDAGALSGACELVVDAVLMQGLRAAGRSPRCVRWWQVDGCARGGGGLVVGGCTCVCSARWWR
jgi:hypothetical protein